MEGRKLMRRGFIINSSVLILLIPLMLLLATYEDVSYQIVQAQNERLHIDRTSQVVSSIEIDFEKALSVSARRALIATTEYVATRDFIRDRKANETIADLILWGQSRGIDTDQSLKAWLMNITLELKNQGYTIVPSIDEILSQTRITVAPLDSFRIAVIAKLPKIKITSRSGRVVYEGSIPPRKNATVIVSIEGIEDTFISRETYDLYHRIIRACDYPYPELLERPIISIDGTGVSDTSRIVGIYGASIQYNETHVWSGDSYITGFNEDPKEIFKSGDTGILVFEPQQGDQTTWCSELPYRINVTINSPQQLSEYQVRLDLTGVNPFSSLAYPPEIEVYYADCTGPIRYWVEKWEDNEKILWIRVNLTSGQNTVSIYFDPNVNGEWGDPKEIFDIYENFSEEASLDLVNTWITNVANQFAIENGRLKLWGDWNGKYLNLRKQFSYPVIVEGEWQLEQVGIDETGDTDLAVSFMSSLSSTPYSSGSIDAVYDGTSNYQYCTEWFLWWCINWETDYGGKRIVYKGNDNGGTRVTTTNPVRFQINYTYTQITFWDEIQGTLSHLGTMFIPFYIGISADTDSDTRYGYFYWLRVRKYSYPEPTTSFNSVDHKPSTQNIPVPARAYDIQPLVECIARGYYFGIYNAPSFFERLEGSFSPERHLEYEELANKTQDKLGISYGGEHYPIGLVSFILPSEDRIKLILATAGLDPNSPNPNGQTCFDYYFLKYYIDGNSTARKPGKGVYGISYGDVLIDDEFYIDIQTALAIFGNDQVAVGDLLAQG